jgi:DNA-binding NarL/FixJ family response regulator
MSIAAAEERRRTQTPTAVVVDPEPSAAAFGARVGAWLGAEIVAETTSVVEAPELVDRHSPDLLLLPFDDAGACLRLAEHVRDKARGTQLVVVADGTQDSSTYRRLLARGALVVLSPISREQRGENRMTRREWEIASLLASGLSNREIARHLWVTERTVKFHLSNVYRKLGVASRREAVAALTRPEDAP